MKTRRKTTTTTLKLSKEKPSSAPPHPASCKFKTLIHTPLCNSEGFSQLQVLKSLYAILVQLSSQVGSAFCKVELTRLVDALFQNLETRFRSLFSALCNADSGRQCGVLSSICAKSEEFTLLLRCCLVAITLPHLNQVVVLDKGGFLLLVFTELRSRHVVGEGVEDVEVRFSECLSRDSSLPNGVTSSVSEDFVASLRFLKSSHPCLPLLLELVEVFVDELLVHKSLREKLMLFDCLLSRDVLFANNLKHDDVRKVLELIACHFILSFSDQQVCDNILDRLSWECGKDRRATQLGVNQGMLLLLDSSFLSAPEIFQSHLILMVSEAIGIDSAHMSTSPDVGLMKCYLLAFERSVVLYNRYVYALHIDEDSQCALRPDLHAHRKSSHSSFDIFLRPTTMRHFDRLLSKLDDGWHYCAKNATRYAKADLLLTSFAFIEEIKALFPDSCKDKMLSFLQALIMAASKEANESPSCEKVQASLQSMFLIASILKSMNASLLQAIKCLEKCDKVGNSKTLKDFTDCKEYDFIVRVITCFQKLNGCLPLLRDPLVCSLLQGNKDRYTETKQMQMLLHFCCFLALGFRYKLEFLVKGCIFTLMTVLNLIVFEDGHLDSVDSLLVYISGVLADSFRGELDKTQSRPQNIRKSSHVVASKFQKIQTSISSRSSPRFSTDVSNDEASAMHVEEETCSGEIYLNCIFENSKQPPDIDDLSDFIECKRGKDYSGWLKERDKYRKWKVNKMAVLRWKKRKRTLHSINGSRP